MYPPECYDRCSVELALVNDPETAEEVREALAIARAQAEALREELRQVRAEQAQQRAELAALLRWKGLGVALADELEGVMGGNERQLGPAQAPDGPAAAHGLAPDAAARLRRLLAALLEWRHPDGV